MKHLFIIYNIAPFSNKYITASFSSGTGVSAAPNGAGGDLSASSVSVLTGDFSTFTVTASSVTAGSSIVGVTAVSGIKSVSIGFTSIKGSAGDCSGAIGWKRKKKENRN